MTDLVTVQPEILPVQDVERESVVTIRSNEIHVRGVCLTDDEFKVLRGIATRLKANDDMRSLEC